MIEKNFDKDKNVLLVKEPHIPFVEYHNELPVTFSAPCILGHIEDTYYVKNEFGPRPNPNKTWKRMLCLVEYEDGEKYWTIGPQTMTTVKNFDVSLNQMKDLCDIQSCLTYEFDLWEDEDWSKKLAVYDVLE